MPIKCHPLANQMQQQQQQLQQPQQQQQLQQQVAHPSLAMLQGQRHNFFNR